MKKLKINYLFIGILALLLAVALWPSIPWFGKADNRIAAIQARGELRVSTIHTPLTYNEINGKPFGLDYELAKQFADYLGVKLKVTVRQNISQLFDDLDNGNADLLAAGLVYNSERVKNYQPGPTYYSVSQQLVYKVGQYRPRTLGNLTAEQLTVAPGHVVVNDLQTLKETKFPELSWKVDDKKGSAELMEDVIERPKLSQEEQAFAHKEAEEVVRDKLVKSGYDCSGWILDDDNDGRWHSYNQIEGKIKDPDGVPVNVVVKSAKGGYIYLSATDFEFLTQNSKNILLVWDGDDVHSVSGDDLFTKDSNVNLIFDTEYTPKHYYAALSKVFQYIKRTTFAVKDPKRNTFSQVKSFGMDAKTEGIQELFDDNDFSFWGNR